MRLDVTVQGENGSRTTITLADDTTVVDAIEFLEALGISGWDLDYKNKRRPAMIHDSDQGKVMLCAQKRQDYGLFAAVALNTIWS